LLDECDHGQAAGGEAKDGGLGKKNEVIAKLRAVPKGWIRKVI
jgi:hypothetical protein